MSTVSLEGGALLSRDVLRASTSQRRNLAFSLTFFIFSLRGDRFSIISHVFLAVFLTYVSF